MVDCVHCSSISPRHEDFFNARRASGHTRAERRRLRAWRIAYRQLPGLQAIAHVFQRSAGWTRPVHAPPTFELAAFVVGSIVPLKVGKGVEAVTNIALHACLGF